MSGTGDVPVPHFVEKSCRQCRSWKSRVNLTITGAVNLQLSFAAVESVLVASGQPAPSEHFVAGATDSLPRRST